MKDTVPPPPPPTPDKGFVFSVSQEAEGPATWIWIAIIFFSVMTLVFLGKSVADWVGYHDKIPAEVPTPDQMHLVWITITEPDGKRVSVPWLLPTNITFTIDK